MSAGISKICGVIVERTDGSIVSLAKTIGVAELTPSPIVFQKGDKWFVQLTNITSETADVECVSEKAARAISQSITLAYHIGRLWTVIENAVKN